MEQQFLEPQVRDKAITTTCMNLAMARVLKPRDFGVCMEQVSQLSDTDLAKALLESRQVMMVYLEKVWVLN